MKGGLFRRKREDRTGAFEQEIQRQEDVLFGVALFFEGLNVLHAGQESIIQLHRRDLRKIIEQGQVAVDEARQMLQKVRDGEVEQTVLDEIKFTPCAGHSDPPEMTRRAECLVKAYGELFPERSRKEPFLQEDILRLMDAAAEALDGADA